MSVDVFFIHFAPAVGCWAPSASTLRAEHCRHSATIEPAFRFRAPADSSQSDEGGI